MRIGILGTGTISSALVRGIAGLDHEITVSQRSVHHAEALAEAFSNVSIADNQGVLDASDVIVLGLLAEQAPAILAPLRFRPDHRVISLMAGLQLSEVPPMVAPATAAALMLPFPAIAIGGSPVIVQGDAGLVADMIEPGNRIFPLESDAELAAYLSAQAVLSPVARMVSDAAGWLGKRVDDAGQGEDFLRMLIASSLRETPSDALIEALNTPGGYNQRLRLHMENSGMGETLTRGLDRLSSEG